MIRRSRNTAARLGQPQLWDARIEAIRVGGMPAIGSEALALSNASAEGYIACCEAIRDMDLCAILGRIQAKSLVIAGKLDAASPPADVRFLSSHIAGARYLELAAAHMTNTETAELFIRAVIGFLTDEGGAA